MKSFKNLFWLLIPLMLGTTFIIKEGGVEVGRYSEDDGSDRVEVVDEGAPASKAAVHPDSPVNVPEAASAEAKEIANAGQLQKEVKETWTMMGTALDVVRLKNVTSGDIVFSNGTINIQAPIGWNGSFSAKVPKLDGGGGYLVSAMLPGGKRAKAFLGESGAFKGMAYADRLRLRSVTQMQTPLKGHSVNLEIGLYPENLTPKEQADYKTVMTQKGSGG